MTTVTNIVTDAASRPLPDVLAEIFLLAPDEGDAAWTDDSQVLSRVSVRTNSSGEWSLNLIPNSELTPSGTAYKVFHYIPGTVTSEAVFIVPPTGGPYTLFSLLTDAPEDIPLRASLIDFSGLPSSDPHILGKPFTQSITGKTVVCISGG